MVVKNFRFGFLNLGVKGYKNCLKLLNLHLRFNRSGFPCRERSILSRNDLIQLEGVVAKVLGGGTMEIQCDNDLTIRGVLSGRMKKHRIKVMVGDRVQVSVSPYDTTHGLITYRF